MLYVLQSIALKKSNVVQFGRAAISLNVYNSHIQRWYYAHI